MVRRITSQQKQRERERRRDHNQSNPAAAGRVFLRCIGRFRSLDSLWRKFKRPCHNQSDRESRRDRGNKYLHHPGRRLEGRKQDRSYLHQQPRDYRVSNRNLVNVASLQLSEKLRRIHWRSFNVKRLLYIPGQDCETSASNRGSPRRGSRYGSTLMKLISKPVCSRASFSSQSSA